MNTTQEQILANGEVTPEFIDQEEETLFAIAAMGEEAHRFFHSDLGRYVTGAAKQDIQEIQEKLLTISPWRKRKIQHLQNQAKAAQLAISWLAEVITNGDDAHQQLLARRDENL